MRKEDQITRDPLVGGIFENLVIIELLKERYNRGLLPDLYFFRDSNGNEVDLLIKNGRELIAVEIKSGSTFSSAQLKGLKRFQGLAAEVSDAFLVYNGDSLQLSAGMRALNFRELLPITKCFE